MGRHRELVAVVLPMGIAWVGLLGSVGNLLAQTRTPEQWYFSVIKEPGAFSTKFCSGGLNISSESVIFETHNTDCASFEMPLKDIVKVNKLRFGPHFAIKMRSGQANRFQVLQGSGIEGSPQQWQDSAMKAITAAMNGHGRAPSPEARPRTIAPTLTRSPRFDVAASDIQGTWDGKFWTTDRKGQVKTGPFRFTVSFSAEGTFDISAGSPGNVRNGTWGFTGGRLLMNQVLGPCVNCGMFSGTFIQKYEMFLQGTTLVGTSKMANDNAISGALTQGNYLYELTRDTPATAQGFSSSGGEFSGADAAALDRIRSGSHTPTPTPNSSVGAGASSQGISIRNQTPFQLKVYLRGPVSRSISVAPRATETLQLPTGSYEEAAEVRDSQTLPFYGRHDQQPGIQYMLTFSLN